MERHAMLRAKELKTIMALKTYFKGKTGFLFWFNIILMLALVVGIPVFVLSSLDMFTHHGEKIEVPNVVGQSVYDAEDMLADRALKAVVVDSVYEPKAKPGYVLEQKPAAGFEVKSDRMIYLTINLKGKPLVKFPDVVNNCSYREAEGMLKTLGFKLTEPKRIQGRQKDWVVGVKQGVKELRVGEMVSRDRALTILVGAGVNDSIYLEEDTVVEESSTDFEIQL